MTFKKWLTEEEHKELEDEMSKIILAVRDEIIKGGKWMPSPATRAAEKEIERIQKEIMTATGTIAEFKEACEKWKQAGTKTV